MQQEEGRVGAVNTGTNLLSQSIRDKYEVYEYKHACAILYNDFRAEWDDIVGLLESFKLSKSWLTSGGGAKSPISRTIDTYFYDRGWQEKTFDTSVTVDGNVRESPTHSVDCYRNRIGLEIEWNNKDPFFDRDLNNFRLLHELRVISVGIIITRSDELQQIFNDLGRGTSYGASTTHMGKLLPKIDGGGGGGCPLLVIGITKATYDENG